MEQKNIQQHLLTLTDVEAAFLHETNCFTQQNIKQRYTKFPKNPEWVIHNEKIMEKKQLFTVRKHDRFVPFEAHQHDFFEMMFVYSGTIVQSIHGKEIEIHPGDLIFLDMNVAHAIQRAGEEDLAVNIIFKKDFFDWIFMSQMGYNDLISNFIVKGIYERQQFKQYLFFKTGSNTTVWHLMMNILSEHYENRIGMETAIKAYLLLLFTEIFREYQTHLSDPFVHKIDHQVVCEFLKYIDTHYRTFSLKAMAQYFNYNIDYIGKVVKKHTGKTISQLVKEKRLQQSKILLRNTKDSVFEIAQEVGYSNVSFFYKNFKSAFGETPHDFRVHVEKNSEQL